MYIGTYLRRCRVVIVYLSRAMNSYIPGQRDEYECGAGGSGERRRRECERPYNKTHVTTVQVQRPLVVIFCGHGDDGRASDGGRSGEQQQPDAVRLLGRVFLGERGESSTISGFAKWGSENSGDGET